MSKFDEQVARMNYLMEYRTPGNKNVSTGIEYTTTGADGKTYGIIKEGTKYYIKTTSKENANLKESYEYIGGFVNRGENAYKSYNDATKHLELKLMNLNEAYNKQGNTSTVDLNRSQKVMTMLTEEARKELDRIHMIMENADTIGMNNVSDPEGKHKASDPKAQGDPYTKGTSASLDKDPSTNGCEEISTDKADKMLQDADKMPSTGDKSTKEYEKAKVELDGESVATKELKGKSVKMNESFDMDGVVDTPMDDADLDEPYDDGEDADLEGLEGNPSADLGDEEGADITDVPEDGEDYGDDINFDDELSTLGYGDNEGEGIEDGSEDGLVGFDNDEPDMMMENEDNTEPTESGEKALKGPKGNGQSVAFAEPKVGDKVNVNENEDNTEPEKSGEKAMKGPNGSLPVQSWDKMNESEIEALAESVCNKLLGKKKVVKENKKPAKKKETLQEAINRIVKEEATKLNVWGQHPRYGKEPMTLPPNTEVMKGTADRDFNDNSTKGNERYGKKIGNAKPFDILVNDITDSVVNMVKESIKKK